MTHILMDDKVIYHMDNKIPYVLKINSGDEVLVYTKDCFNNELHDESIKLCDLRLPGNPATGPIYVEGATSGDSLRIHILSIEVDELGFVGCGPTKYYFKEQLSSYHSKSVSITDGFANLFDEVKIPIDPMIGVIGVAPLNETIPTALVGAHGGNIDCRMIKKGAILYLPVYHDGALLSVGDLHGLMGDGEVSECGLEVSGKVLLRIEVVKDMKREEPAIFYNNTWITIASCKTLDEAAEEATRMMYEFLLGHGVDAYKAGVYLSLLGNLAVCQNCGMDVTMRMELDLGPIFGQDILGLL